MIQQELNLLNEQIQRLYFLQDQLPVWQQELEEAEQLAAQLQCVMNDEQQDVQKLENGGISTVFHKLTGKMEEKLDKERQEAKTAAEEYHAAAAQAQQLRTTIEEARRELEALEGCTERYSTIMEQRISQLDMQAKNAPCESDAQALRLTAQMERRRKSLREALLLCSQCSRRVGKNLAALSQAQQEDPRIQAELLVETMLQLQAKLAQMGIDPGPHIYICPYLKAPVAYLAGGPGNTDQAEQAENARQQLTETDEQIADISEKLTQALGKIEARLNSD